MGVLLNRLLVEQEILQTVFKKKNPENYDGLLRKKLWGGWHIAALQQCASAGESVFSNPE